MALESLENMLGQRGCVKLADGIYLWGEITETGIFRDINLMPDNYALLEGLSNDKQIRVCIWAEKDLIRFDPLIEDKTGRIIGRK